MRKTAVPQRTAYSRSRVARRIARLARRAGARHTCAPAASRRGSSMRRRAYAVHILEQAILRQAAGVFWPKVVGLAIRSQPTFWPPQLSFRWLAARPTRCVCSARLGSAPLDPERERSVLVRFSLLRTEWRATALRYENIWRSFGEPAAVITKLEAQTNSDKQWREQAGRHATLAMHTTQVWRACFRIENGSSRAMR